jgi:hypothetical protein
MFMTYRVEYHGSAVEVSTLDAAIEAAKDAILGDVGPVSAWTIEHDETINDWFVQGVTNGEPVGSTAVVAGPEPMDVGVQPDPPQHHNDGSGGAPGLYRTQHSVEPAGDEPLRSVLFAGVTPAEAFGKATTWLAGRPDSVTISDVSWRPASEAEDSVHLRVYYHVG